MAYKRGFISYTLASIASICFISGLLVLTGGEHAHGKFGDDYIHDR